MSQALFRNGDPTKEEFNSFRANARGVNPRYRNIMKHLKLNNPDFLDKNDPLKKRFAEFSEYNKDGWAAFRNEMDPKAQERTLQSILSEPIARPPKPEIPKALRGPVTGSYYQLNAPPENDNYVYVGDRDSFEGNWHRIGDPITKEAVGEKSQGLFANQRLEKFQSKNHNANINPAAHFSDQALRKYLSDRGISGQGDRESLMRRYVNAVEGLGKSQELQIENLESSREDLGRHIQPVSDEILNQGVLDGKNARNADILNKEKVKLQQAHQLRNPGLRLEQNPSLLQQNNPNPVNQIVPNNPVRIDGTQVSNAEAAGLRQWGEQNIANQSSALAQRNLLGTGANPMTISNLPGAARAGGAIEGAAATGAAETAATGAAGLMGRAMPVISLALLANSFMQNSNASQQMEKDEARQKSMRT